MKLAVVAQRYGQAINGGAELHARYIAERLARHVTVEVLTTCAGDYVTWQNDLKPGTSTINGVPVRRFRVSHKRNPEVFGLRSERVFSEQHSIAQELSWLDAEGPVSPALVRYIARHEAEYDYLIFFSYRYYHAYYGARVASSRAVLVPTAERDPVIGLSIFGPVFKGVRALMYNSPEERAMIQAVSDNHSVPSVVVGIGSDVPQTPQPSRFRQKHNIRGPFAIYVGRIDENKGCKQLFEFFGSYLAQGTGQLSLVLIGNSILTIPSHPRIRHLGFLEDADKFDAMAAADLLIMPSYLESLSMVALEAWGLGRPVVANAKCDVLRGQCMRSNAGLYYDDEGEFVGALRAIEQNRWISAALGRNGRQFFRNNYEWPVIERKYLDMFSRLSADTDIRRMVAIPSWHRRHRRDCPRAADVLASLPAGPVVVEDEMGAGVGHEAPRTIQPAPPAAGDVRRDHARSDGRRHSRPPRSGWRRSARR